MLCYFDSSAVVKLLLDERESDDVTRWVEDPLVAAVSSRLLETELLRVAARESIPLRSAGNVLDQFDLFDLEPWDFRAAGSLPDRAVRALDALHISAALRVEADALITYDDRMADAALEMGLAVIRPGVDKAGSITVVG